MEKKKMIIEKTTPHELFCIIPGSNIVTIGCLSFTGGRAKEIISTFVEWGLMAAYETWFYDYVEFDCTWRYKYTLAENATRDYPGAPEELDIQGCTIVDIATLDYDATDKHYKHILSTERKDLEIELLRHADAVVLEAKHEGEVARFLDAQEYDFHPGFDGASVARRIIRNAGSAIRYVNEGERTVCEAEYRKDTTDGGVV